MLPHEVKFREALGRLEPKERRRLRMRLKRLIERGGSLAYELEGIKITADPRTFVEIVEGLYPEKRDELLVDCLRRGMYEASDEGMAGRIAMLAALQAKTAHPELAKIVLNAFKRTGRRAVDAMQISRNLEKLLGVLPRLLEKDPRLAELVLLRGKTKVRVLDPYEGKVVEREIHEHLDKVREELGEESVEKEVEEIIRRLEEGKELKNEKDVVLFTQG